jgi:glyoxylase-like metal-dependent hydrolase (beta-lactamase superfamily II)
MRVDEIAPGLWRWTGLHPDWTPEQGGPEGWEQEVSSVYAESPDAVVLIDPLVPPEDAARFWAALDRDVQRARSPVHVLLTVYWHGRSARQLADRYGAEIWAHEKVLGTEERTVEPTRTFAFGETLPGGVLPHDAVRFEEAIMWLPAHRSLVFGDVVLGADDGVRLCPESWLGEGGSHADLKEALRPLLDLPVERLIVAHGEPVLERGHEVLARVLADGDQAPSAA